MLIPYSKRLLTLLVFLFGGAALNSGCAPINQDIESDLSTDPKTCVNGLRYLPFTNGTDEAFTSEGKEIPCKVKASPNAK